MSFEIRKDEAGEIVSYYAHRKAAPRQAILKIEKLYQKLRAIEINQNVNVAYKYFIGLLEEQNTNYEDYISSIMQVEANVIKAYFDTEKPKKKSFLSRLFK